MEFGDEEVRQAPLALRIWVPRRSVRGKLGSRATRRVCFAEVVRNGGWEHRAIENRAAPCTVSIFADAATSRLRPILLTTTTTVVGMIPLALAGDTWGPLAYAVMFGLFFSVIITLVLIQIIYHRKPGGLT